MDGLVSLLTILSFSPVFVLPIIQKFYDCTNYLVWSHYVLVFFPQRKSEHWFCTFFFLRFHTISLRLSYMVLFHPPSLCRLTSNALTVVSLCSHYLLKQLEGSISVGFWDKTFPWSSIYKHSTRSITYSKAPSGIPYSYFSESNWTPLR